MRTTTPIGPTQIQWHLLAPFGFSCLQQQKQTQNYRANAGRREKSSSETDAKITMEIAATRGRRFPTLAVGDTVRILRKKKAVGDKEYMSNFKEGEHKVASSSENLGQKFYKLTDGREYIRANIVKL